MKNAIFTGSIKGEFFATVVPVENIKTLFKMIHMGRDNVFEEMLTMLATNKAKVISAMAWESNLFMNEMVELIETGGRFAIKHGDLEFGCAADGVNSAAAFANKEY